MIKFYKYISNIILSKKTAVIGEYKVDFAKWYTPCESGLNILSSLLTAITNSSILNISQSNELLYRYLKSPKCGCVRLLIPLTDV